MNTAVKRFYLFLFLAISQVVFAQNYPDGLSSGTLTIDQKEVPVKIFTTTSAQAFVDFTDKSPAGDVLIILNDDLNEYGDTSVFTAYRTEGFQVLDKNFIPVSSQHPISKFDFKYLYKPSDIANIITPEKQVELSTPFKIWDPNKGIKIGGFLLHYYSLMFVIAFGLGYFLMSKIFKIDNVNRNYLDPLFTWTLIGTILGARIGHVVFYQPELFTQDFWSVFLPIQTKPEVRFTGFSGLASHGAAIALIFTTLYYAMKIIKKHPFWVYDRIGIVVAIGGAFVRLGNFFNSEIIGKPVDSNSFFAVLFPQMSSEYGVSVPRYPTQLMEAGLYALLFVLLWCLYRFTKKKYQQGFLFGVFFAVLWSIRFFVEFLKEPQGDEFISFLGLNTGQVLSLPFIIAGLVIMVYSKKLVITPQENEKPEYPAS